MSNTIVGIPIGNKLGNGAYSTVYEYPSDSSKVVMNGDFSDDVFKLNLYAIIGCLHLVHVNRHTNQYAAILTRMFDQYYDDDTRERIDSMVNLADEIRRDSRESDDQNSEHLIRFATDPRISDRAASLVMFLLDHNILDYHWDNHNGNWLVTPDNDCLPLDVFNANAGYVKRITSELTNAISDKIEESD